jgi:small subunit ribosomal protein S8e
MNMAISQSRSLRKSTGARYKRILLTKKKHSNANKPNLPKIGEEKRKTIRTRGGNDKHVLLQSEFANIAEKGKISKIKIETVVENSANTNFVRRNVLTKGAIIETKKGKAIITNSPAQDGFVNAKLQ